MHKTEDASSARILQALRTVFLAVAVAGIAAPVLGADPVIAPGPAPAGITDEDSATPLANVSVSDADNDDVVLVIGVSPAASGVLSHADLSASGGSYTSSALSISDAHNLLDDAVFTPDSNRLADGAVEPVAFTISVDDGVVAAPPSTVVTLSVTGENTAPEVDLANSTLDINDDATGLIFSGATVTDDDGDDVTATITLPDGRGSFSTAPANFSSAPGAGGTIVYTVSAASPASVQAFLRALVFTPIPNRIPLDETETTTFTVRVRDGAGASDSDTRNLRVTPINDPPTLSGALRATAQATAAPDNSAGTFLPFAGEAGPPAIAAVSVSDPDVVRIGGSIVPQRVRIEVDGAATGSDGFAHPGSSEAVTDFSVPAGAGAYQAQSAVNSGIQAVPLLPANNALPVGSFAAIDVTLAAKDSKNLAASSTISGTIHIESINDVPVVEGSLTALSIPENSTGFPLLLDITDPDIGDGVGITVSVTADKPSLGTLSPSGTLTAGATLAGAENSVRTARFTPIPDAATAADNQVTFTFTVTDRNNGSGTDTAVLTITPVNDAPTITGIPTALDFITDEPGSQLLPFQTAAINDVDAGGTQELTVVVTMSNPALGFFLDPDDGSRVKTVTLVDAPSVVTALLQSLVFEPATNIVPVDSTALLGFTVAANDGTVTITNERRAITIIGVNGAPDISGVPQDPLEVDPSDPRPFAGVSISDEIPPEWEPDTAYRAGDEVTVISPSGDSATFYRRNADGTSHSTEIQTTDWTEFTPDPIVVTIELDDALKGALQSPSGAFVEQEPLGSGIYVFEGDPIAATAAIQALIFNLDPDFLFPASSPGGTTFTITAVDPILNGSVEELAIIIQGARRNWLVTDESDPLVDTSTPPVAGTLRWAIAEAANNDAITFAFDRPRDEYPVVIRLDWRNPVLELARNTTLYGPGADKLIISGDTDQNLTPDTQIFDVKAAVTMEGLTLSRGRADFGAGGAVQVGPGARLVMRFCAVTDSVASSWGGGIDVDGGSLVLEHSLLQGNRTDASLGLGGGAVSIFTDQPCAILNTTFSRNTQSSADGVGGGALYIETVFPETELLVDIVHCTFAENHDQAELGSSLHANVAGTRVRIRSTIMADGRDNNIEVRGAALTLSEGGNISDDFTRQILTQGGQPKEVIIFNHAIDLINADPLLLPLASRGGPTATYGLAAGSPAIDGLAVAAPDRDGDNFADPYPGEATDQRGVIRGSPADAGAFEADARRRLAINEIHFDVTRSITGFATSNGGAATAVTSPAHRFAAGASVEIAGSDTAAYNGIHDITLIDADTFTIPVAFVDDPDPRGSASESQFLEIYNQRDSEPVNLAGYDVCVDGTVVHTFGSATPIIQPGAAVLLATRGSLVDGGGSPATPVIESVAPLGLARRGLVELKPADGGAAIRSSYSGTYVDPQDPADDDPFPFESLTLLPQFNGDLVPHTFASGTDVTNSPGDETNGSDIGGGNAPPVAATDDFTVSEDKVAALTALDNDFDDDGSDAIFIVDLSATSDPDVGAENESATALSAAVSLLPDDGSGGGTSISYDPRSALNGLAEGEETIDTFFYEVIDIGTGTITGIEAGSGGGTRILSAGHRLEDGDEILISGADLTDYNGTFTVAVAADEKDSFEISVPLAVPAPDDALGVWETTEPRIPRGANPNAAISEGGVTVRVLGANDPPAPAPDFLDTPEDQPLRVMAAETLAGSTVEFDTDAAYAATPVIADDGLLGNDDDVDSDDTQASLRVVGVLSDVFAIAGYSGTDGEAPVTVETEDPHGLATGATILISGYGGHPSYNGFHAVEVIDGTHLAIPDLLFVAPPADESPAPGIWASLTDANRLSATTAAGANAQLEIRADADETSVVYDPSVSSTLDMLGVPNGSDIAETHDDSFYYAVRDSHGAVTIAEVTVTVSGVNDSPVPGADPAFAEVLAGFVGDGESLADVASRLDPQYIITDVATGETAVRVAFDPGDGSGSVEVILSQIFWTDEHTALSIAPDALLANDSDVDDIDTLTIAGVVGAESALGAAISFDGSAVSYDPAASEILNALAREESIVDTFEAVVSDNSGNSPSEIPSLVIVVVTGLNETPVALDDSALVFEDGFLALEPPQSVLANDIEFDIDGHDPDDFLVLVPLEDVRSKLPGAPPGSEGALVSAAIESLFYDPSQSSFLDGLAEGDIFSDCVTYEATDGSFLFASDDFFKVTADTPSATLHVLSNDRNLTGFAGGGLAIVSAGAPSDGGTVAVSPDGKSVLYAPRVNFVGDESFLYTVADGLGNFDSAVVRVRATVEQLNGNLQASPDVFTVAMGESPVLHVLANDNRIPAFGAALTLTRIVSEPVEVLSGGGSTSTDDEVAIDPATNSLTYRQLSSSPTPYSTTFSYEVSGGGTSSAVAQVTVLVVDRTGTLHTRHDYFSVAQGSSANALDVLGNDNILPGTGEGLTVTGISEHVPSSGGGSIAIIGDVSVSADGLRIFYTPAPGFVGDELFDYTMSDGLGGTGAGTVRVSVGRLSTSSDFFVLLADPDNVVEAVPLDVLANDAVLQSGDRDVTLSLPANSTLGNLTVGIHPDSGAPALLFDAGDADGEETLTYTVTNALNQSADGELTIVLVNDGVHANVDTFAVEAESSANRLEVLANDSGRTGRTLSVVRTGSGSDAPSHGGTAAISEDGKALLYTPAPGFRGEEVFTYQVTDAFRTDWAKVIVRVSDGALFANDDAYTVFLEEAADGSGPIPFVLPVTANDRVIPDLGQLLTVAGIGIDDGSEPNAPDPGDAEIGPGGTTLVYTPKEPGQETFTYVLSDGTARRAEATVTIEVLLRVTERDMETNDDAFTVASGSSNNVLDVLANDEIRPATADAWTITSVSTPDQGGRATIVGRTLRFAPASGFTGIETFTYDVSDGFGGTGSAAVTVRVGDVQLAEDVFAALSGSVDNRFEVLANDGILPENAEPAEGRFSITAVQMANPLPSAPGAVAIDGGDVLFTPGLAAPGDYPYVETFTYTVEDDTGVEFTASAAVTVYELGSDRDSANLLVAVVGVNDGPMIAGPDDQGIILDTASATPFAGVTVSDVDDQGDQILRVIITLSDPAMGALLGDFAERSGGAYFLEGTPAEITAALQAVTFEPAENIVAAGDNDSLTFAISVDDGFVSAPAVDSDTVIAVEGVNDAPAMIGVADEIVVYYRTSVRPFAGVTLADPDNSAAQPLTVTLTLSDPTHGFLSSLGGFIDNGAGVYSITAPAAVASGALREILFTPTTGSRVTGANPEERTGISIEVSDGFAPALTAMTEIVAHHSFVQRVFAQAQPDDNHRFGAAVSVGGGVLVVGAPDEDLPGDSLAGAAYLYVFDETASPPWREVQRLEAFDADRSDAFGTDVAVSKSGAIIVVGSPGDDDGQSAAGSAYVFRRDQDAGGAWLDHWTLTDKVTSSTPRRDAFFGSSVAVAGETAVIGEPARSVSGSQTGAAHIVDLSVDPTPGIARTPTLSLVAGQAAYSGFGFDVATDGNTALVGSSGDADRGSGAGAVYVFARTSGWARIDRWLAPDGQAGDAYGYSISVDGDRAIIGAPGSDQMGNNAGAAYVVSRNGGVWNSLIPSKLMVAPVIGGDAFGSSVGISVSPSATRAVVGMPFDGGASMGENESRRGAAFLFDENVGGLGAWGQTERLVKAERVNNDEYGTAVAIDAHTVAVGVPYSQGTPASSNRPGAGFLYQLKFNNAPIARTLGETLVTYEEQPFDFLLEGLFGEPDLGDANVISAALAGGSPLPPWLTLQEDAVTGMVELAGVPPLGGIGDVKIVVTSTDEDDESDSFLLTLSILPSGPFLEIGEVANVGSDAWSTVALSRTYANMVVVATPVLNPGEPPVVTRVADALGSSFKVAVMRADGGAAPVSGVRVHYLVVESNAYTEAGHGVTMEAFSIPSAATDASGSWDGKRVAFSNDYDRPVVVGQVMTMSGGAAPDSGDWSAFWAHGATVEAPPSGADTGMWIGKHVGEDDVTSRAPADLGYVVIETGSGRMRTGSAARGFLAGHFVPPFISGKAPASPLDFSAAAVDSYTEAPASDAADGPDSISAAAEDGATLAVSGNAWKSVEVDLSVTESTILEFDFFTNAEGEIHGIGFDSDATPGLDGFITLFGSAGPPDLGAYPGDGSVAHYIVQLGDYVLGDIDRIVFAADDDRPSPTGTSWFRNVVARDGAVRASTYRLGLASPTHAVLSSAGMANPDGSWPVLFGAAPVTSAGVCAAADEDQIGDSERDAFPAPIAYLVFGSPDGTIPLLDPKGMSEFDRWRSAEFPVHVLENSAREGSHWGLLADPDRDGLNNLVEYAVGGAALTSGDSIVTPLEIHRDMLSGDIVLRYQERSDDPMLAVSIEAVSRGADGSWSWIALSGAGLTESRRAGAEPNFEEVTVTVSDPGNSARLFRLSVSYGDSSSP